MFAGDFVEDYEVMVPFQALQSVGCEVDVICPGKEEGDTVSTAVHDFTEFQTYVEHRGHNFAINKNIDGVDPKDYDGLYITGGRAPEYIRLNSKIIELTQYFFENDKPVAAICHGIQIMVAADVVKDRKMTCYPAIGPDVTMAGGDYENVPGDANKAIVDGNLVSAPAWGAHPAILEEFYKLLGIQISG